MFYPCQLESWAVHIDQIGTGGESGTNDFDPNILAIILAELIFNGSSNTNIAWNATHIREWIW